MTYRSNDFYNTRSQENGFVSATKAIIETHVAGKRSYNYSKRIIKKTTIIVH